MQPEVSQCLEATAFHYLYAFLMVSCLFLNLFPTRGMKILCDRDLKDSRVFTTHSYWSVKGCACMIYTSMAHRQSRRFTGTFWKCCSYDALLQPPHPRKPSMFHPVVKSDPTRCKRELQQTTRAYTAELQTGASSV